MIHQVTHKISSHFNELHYYSRLCLQLLLTVCVLFIKPMIVFRCDSSVCILQLGWSGSGEPEIGRAHV